MNEEAQQEAGVNQLKTRRYDNMCKRHEVRCETGMQSGVTEERKIARDSSWKLAMLPITFCVLLLGLLTTSVWAQSPAPDLTELDLEQLVNIKVTSVSKKEEKLFQAPSAIYVITAEDIRRSGATNIPDLLRMVPGADVAQIDENAWSIGIRGFNNRYSDKVLVLVDGRTVYTPFFSGVYWDQQDVPLEDIERIEVIRGPGGTVWGANAMNGVINIITKNAKETQGGLLSASGGSGDAGEGLAQYGGKIGQKGAYRIFGKFFNIGDSLFQGSGSAVPVGSQAADGWHMAHGGFRSDWDLSGRDTLTVQGDFLKQNGGQTLTGVVLNPLAPQRVYNDQIGVTAWNILGRWTRTLPDGSDMSLQVYDNFFNHLDGGTRSEMNVFDLDFQHHLAIGSRNDVVWGLGYRFTDSRFLPSFDVSFVPARYAESLYSGFVQDHIKLTKSLSITLGSKFEHNGISGFEYSPSAQLTWTPSARQTIWLSAARAIREPARSADDLRVQLAGIPLQNGGVGVLALFGKPGIKAEQLRDFEIGYRAQLSRQLSLDITTFTSYYRQLVNSEPGAPFFDNSAAVPHLVLPLYFDNKAHAHDYGAEIFANWNVTSRWRLSPGLDLIHMNVELDPSSRDTTTKAADEASPRHQFRIRSSLKLSHNLDWDNSLYFVGISPDHSIPSYTRLDTRLGWRLGEFTEFSLVGQNLLTPQHAESEVAFGVIPTLIRRSIYAKITWRF